METHRSGPLHLDYRPDSLSLLLLFPSYWQEVWFNEWLQTRHPDLGCSYLVFWILRWPIEVDLFHLNQKSENSSIFRLLHFKDRRFDPRNGCLQDTWSKVLSQHVLHKTSECLTQKIVAWYFKYWSKWLLFVFCVALKQSFWIRVYKHIYSVFTGWPSWLYPPSFMFLLLLPNISNPHALPWNTRACRDWTPTDVTPTSTYDIQLSSKPCKSHLHFKTVFWFWFFFLSAKLQEH